MKNEIRLGNIITSKSSTIPFEVTEEDFLHILENPDHYLRVPLTEEWLVKFGFVTRYLNEDRSKPLMWKVEKNRHIDIYYEKQVNAYVFKINSLQYSYPINSVHQLQNLYHALTGEELTIKTN